MENNTDFNQSDTIPQTSKIQQALRQFFEKLNEQEWFIEIKTKWDDLDTQHKVYLKWGIISASMVGIFSIFITTVWSLQSLKSQLNTKSELLLLVQNAQEEMKRLKEQIPQSTESVGSENTPWSPFFEQAASQSNIDKSLIVIGEEQPGSNGEIAKESMFELKLSKVNIKQLVKFSYYIENGSRPAKVRHLAIDTHPDLSGYMDAKVAVSGFSIKSQQ